MICIPIIAKTNGEAIEKIERAKEADVLELRLDRIDKPDASKLFAKANCIATNRKKEEGGHWKGSEEKRIALLKEAAESGAAYVDVELSSGQDAIDELKKARSKLIVSHHDFEKTPDDLWEIYRRIVRSGCDVAKIAATAKDASDNAKIFQLLKKAPTPLIALCMGHCGSVSRIMYKKYGSFLTYASLEAGEESAQGQIPAAEMKKLYRAHELNPETKLYGVVASPGKHTSSPQMMNAAFQKKKLNAAFVAFRVNRLKPFVESFKPHVKGLAVTMPHKEAIIPLLDSIDQTAEAVGAVNTVLEEKSLLKGYNTDAAGAIDALKQKTEIKGKKVVILGAGGAAKAAAYGAAQENGSLTILNRTAKKAEELAKKHDAKWGSLDQIPPFDVLINCISSDYEPTVKANPDATIMDATYKKTGETSLVKSAKQSGCAVVTGKEMLLQQGYRQFELWTGLAAPQKTMRDAICK